jgi:cytoskeletal protein CcmA (bactofilin family)
MESGHEKEDLMAFGRRSRGDGESTPGAPAPAESGGGLTAFIDQGSEFEGKLSFKDTVRIDGHFRGEIASENTLIVGEAGEVEAAIKSRTVVVSGTVNGPIEASSQLVLHKTAVVNGDVETGSLVVEDGAVLNGRISMRAGEAKAQAKLSAVETSTQAAQTGH